MCHFSAGISLQDIFLGKNLVVAGNTTKILLPGRILACIPGGGGGFFLGRILSVQISLWDSL